MVVIADSVKKPFFKRDSVIPWLFLAPALILILLFYVYPIAQTFYLSFLKYNVLNPVNSKFVGIDNYARIFDDPLMPLILRNTIIWVVVGVIMQFILGFALALLLWRSFRLRGIYQSLVFVPWSIAGFLIGIVFRWMFNAQFGVFSDLLRRCGFVLEMSVLSNPKTALVGPLTGLIWFGIPFFAIMILAALQGVSDEMLEAAEIDGANSFKRLFSVVIPMIMPTLLVTILLRVIWVFNSADVIYIMTNGGPMNASQTIASYLFHLAYTKHDYSLVSAISVSIMVLLTLYTLAYLKLSKFSEAGDL